MAAVKKKMQNISLDKRKEILADVKLHGRKAAADKHKVHVSTIYYWITQARKKEEEKTGKKTKLRSVKNETPEVITDGNANLIERIAELEEDNEALKKTIGILMKDNKR